MLNAGLKDIRRKPVILSDIMRVLVVGSSEVSITFASSNFLVMEIEGSSIVNMTIVMKNGMFMEIDGSSDVNLTFLREITEEDVEEIINFASRLNTTILGESEYYQLINKESEVDLSFSGSSEISLEEKKESILITEVIEKSKLYGKEGI